MDDMIIEGFFITHGDEIKKAPAECHTIVIGHEHAAATIREGARAETAKAFLVTTYKKKDLIVLPSANPLAEGHDPLSEEPLTPYLKNPAKARAFVVASPGKVLDFGELGKIK